MVTVQVPFGRGKEVGNTMCFLPEIRHIRAPQVHETPRKVVRCSPVGSIEQKGDTRART